MQAIQLPKSIIWYPGSKGKLLKSYAPIFRRLASPVAFYDVFCGTGVVSQLVHQLFPQCQIILNDVDTALMNLYLHLQQNYETFRKVALVLEMLYDETSDEAKKGLYYSHRDFYNQKRGLLKAGDAAMRYFLGRTCYNGANETDEHGNFISNFGVPSKTRKFFWDRIVKFKEMLAYARLFNLDYTDMLPLVLAYDDPVIYLDPPYLNAYKFYKQHFTPDKTEDLCQWVDLLVKAGYTVFFANEPDPYFSNRFPSMTIEKIPTPRHCRWQRKRYDYELLIHNLPSTSNRLHIFLDKEPEGDSMEQGGAEDPKKHGTLSVTYYEPSTLQLSEAYQVFDPLSAEEWRALYDDIAARGIQVPIDVDQAGTVLDGHNRVAIAKVLGIPCPGIVHPYERDADKFEHAVKANLLRRQVSPIAWARAMQRLLDVKGIARQTKRNRFADRDDTLSGLYTEVGVTERTAQRRFALFDALKDYPELVHQVDTGKLSAAAAKREVRQRQGNAKPDMPKKTGSIAELAQIIERCIAQYLHSHEGIGAQVHQHGRQILIDVCEGTDATPSSTEIFPLQTHALLEQTPQNGADVVFDTSVAYQHAHDAQYTEPCPLECTQQSEEHNTVAR